MKTVAVKENSISCFSFVVIPDTQKMARYYPGVFHKMTAWIARHAEDVGIKAVLHLGDVVDQGAYAEDEYRSAWEAMRRIYDTDLPVVIAPGNHDYDVPIVTVNESLQEDKCRNLSMFNRYFGTHRIEDKPWFGGVFEQRKAENMFVLVESEGTAFLILVLEFVPRDEVMVWADRIISENRDRHVIIITHSYMYTDGERVKPGIRANPKVKYQVLSGGNDGEDLWQKHFKHYPNLIAVFSGHHIPGGVSHRMDTGTHGNSVFQSFQNWQEYEYGGSGRIRIVHYDINSKSISVNVYNTLTEQEEVEPGYVMTARAYLPDIVKDSNNNLD